MTSTAVVASPQRQPATALTAPVTTRPDSPPIVVPAMYNPPTAEVLPLGAVATRWAMANAGNAPNASPETARSASRTGKFGESGSSAPAAAVIAAEIIIALTRPIRSANAAQGRTDTASAPVATETARAAVDSRRSHSAASAGSTAWTA